MFDKLKKVEQRFMHLEESLTRPDLSARDLKTLSKERAEIEDVVKSFRIYESVLLDFKEAQQMLNSEDEDTKVFAREEGILIQEKLKECEKELKTLLLPKDPRDEKNVLLEVRAGTGGEEAGIFAGDLFRMYSRFAETQRWTLEVLSCTESAKGGFKEVIAMITGKRVYSRLKYEMGAHRVQRIPTTESQGRIHTSACTVAVLPEAEDVEVDINPGDIRIDTYRASGAGGQHVNRTDSAVRITHIPTGIVAECQDERSQHKNKDKAMKMLRSRILAQKQKEQNDAISSDRKTQVGSGDRSERIRTYNFPQGRLTDHRINLTLYKLDEIMNGDLGDVLDALGAYFTAEQLKNEQF